MNRTDLKTAELEERLRRPAPPPPDDLAERIRAEIPEVAPAAAPPGRGRRRVFLTAAAAVVAMTAAVLVYQTTREVELLPPDGPARTESVPGAAPPPEPASATTDEREALSQTTPPRTEEAPSAPVQAAPSPTAPEPRPTGEQPSEIFVTSPSPPPETKNGDDSRRDELAAEMPIARSGRLEAEEGRTLGPARSERILVEQLAGEPMARPRAPALADVGHRVMPIPEPAPPYPAPPPSTGGTTEPNDQPYGDMFFESYGVNPFVDTEDDRFSTFGLDVDTGSWSVVRRYLEEGHLPPADAVRVEEILNSFDYGDPAPTRGDFAVHIQAGPAPFADGPRYHLVRFGIRAREVADADRLPATLIFVVDVSGSMNRENRLGLVQRSLYLLLDQLRSDDRVGLVVYGSAGRVLLEPTSDLEAIRSAIGRLAAGGSTNAEEGLVLAYELAARHLREEGITRVILCSDGVANVGRTGPESILGRIEREAARGIELTTVGFGMGNYNDVLMEQLADRGDGRYAYVDDLDEARRIFVENLTGTLQTVAADAKVQVEFDPAAVSRYRLLGYENRDVADERFRDDTVDAGEIGAGHAVTALYEIKLAPGVTRRARLATLHLRWRSLATGEVVETAHQLRAADVAADWEASAPQLQLAAVAAEFGEILRRSYWAKEGDLDALFARAQRLSARFEGDLAVAELATLIGRAARLAD